MDRIELEESTGLVPVADTRPRMDEPPPVRLIAVEDVRLLMQPAALAAVDMFYVRLLEFLLEAQTDGPVGEQVYRAENLRLRFAIVDQMPLERDGLRPIGIEVRSLRDAERKLFEHEMDYTRQRGLLPGHSSLLLKDPAGNWIELFETIAV